MTYALDHPHKSLENTPPLKWVRNMQVHGAKLMRNTCNLHARAFASGASESKRQIAQSMFGLSLIPENYRIPERLQALRRFEAARCGWIRKFPNDNVHGMCLDGGWCRWIRNCSFVLALCSGGWWEKSGRMWIVRSDDDGDDDSEWNDDFDDLDDDYDLFLARISKVGTILRSLRWSIFPSFIILT